MKSILWIGVDISKDFFHAAYPQGDGLAQAEFSQDQAGMQDFVAWLPRGTEVQIVLESTGPYWQPLVAFLHSLPEPLACAVVNPRRVRDFARAAGVASKTDSADARLLVDFGRTFTPAALQPQSQAYRQLRALSRRYLQLRQQYDLNHDQRDKALADPLNPATLRTSFDSVLHGETDENHPG